MSWIDSKEEAIGPSPGAEQLCGQDSGHGSQVARSQLTQRACDISEGISCLSWISLGRRLVTES